ncbi:uncharacterized protein LOC101848517 [Aplysia californica]|uniref:Uncharacterized protein LOC101848517 n=1 Tax=Aplysia californica TaxID=6500 RepID=A0ABM0JN95_APLCA|nr:uncharacterized protein LOC101848517 [Aplysia californica]
MGNSSGKVQDLSVLKAEITQLTQGESCEMEFCEGEDAEAELHKHFVRCRKNPGHKKFIPVSQFGTQHLPASDDADGAVAMIKKLAVDTVKLIVRYTSKSRPDKFGLPTLKGKRTPRFGSGVYLPPSDSMENQPCPLKDCPFSKDDHLVTATFSVVTAAHVVYDDDEAVVTSVEFFYDDDKDRSGVVTAVGVQIRFVDEGADLSSLRCISHDLDLFHKLESHKTLTKDVKWSMSDPMAVLISHPHGCSKQISVGDVVERKELTPPQRPSFLRPSFKDGEEAKAMKNASADAKKCLAVLLEKVFGLDKANTEGSGEDQLTIALHGSFLGELRAEGCIVSVSESERDFWQKVLVQTGGTDSSSSDADLGYDRSWLTGVMNEVFSPPVSNFLAAPQKAFSIEALEKDPVAVLELLLGPSQEQETYAPSSYGNVKNLTKFRHMSYSIPSCPGSSGGPVFCWRRDGDELRVSSAPHSRAGNNKNVSGLSVQTDWVPSTSTSS